MITIPFLVGSVDRERLGYWAERAAHATTWDALDLVSRAYRALSWEERAAGHFQNALRLADLSRVDLVSVLAWLDLVVSSLRVAIERWEYTVEEIERAASPDWSALGVVRQQISALQEAVFEIATYVLAQCEIHGLEVPEHCAAVAA